MRGSPDLVLGIHGARRRGPAGAVGVLVAGALGLAISFLTGCGRCDLAAYEAARHQARRAELDASLALADAERHLGRGRLELAPEAAAIEAAVEAAAEDHEGITARLLEDAGVGKAVAAYDARIAAFGRDAAQAREAVGTSMRAAGRLQDEAAVLERSPPCDDQDFSEAYRRGDSTVAFSRRIRNLGEATLPEPGIAVAEARIARLRRELAGRPSAALGPSTCTTAAPELERIDGYLIGRLYWFEGAVEAEAAVSEVPCTAAPGSEDLSAVRKAADGAAVKTLSGQLPRREIDARILAQAECYEVVRGFYRSDSPEARTELRRQIQAELDAVAKEGRPGPGD